MDRAASFVTAARFDTGRPHDVARRVDSTGVIPVLYPSQGFPKARLVSGPSLGRVAELADAQDSGSCVRKDVRVQVPPRPPIPPPGRAGRGHRARYEVG